MQPLLEPVVRPLRPNEMHLAIQWATEEGWNPGPHDCDVFANADPGCLLAGEVNGEPAGVISAAKIAPGFGFMGFLVVPPQFRGLGLGKALWRGALRRLEGRVIGLDAVPEQQANYARDGFVFTHRTLRFIGTAPMSPTPRRRGVREAGEFPFATLAVYDAMCAGCLRPLFLRSWLALPRSRSLVYLREGRVCGMGMVRHCLEGARMGPLFADDPEAADALFEALMGFEPGTPLVIDVPEPNAQAVALMRRFGLKPVMEAARMYRGKVPARPLTRVYGVTSCALG